MKNIQRSLLVLGTATLLCVPSLANAQQYLQTDEAAPWVEISSIPNIGTITPFTRNFSSSSDDGAAQVTIPFAYQFFGTPHSTAYISTNGFLSFSSSSITSYSNQSIPSSLTPNSVIAPWWDDLRNFNTELGRTGVIGTTPNRIFVIQSDGLRDLGAQNGEIKYQIWLYEGNTGRFDVYISGVNNALTVDATSGYEGSGSGTPNGVFRPCGSSGSCSSSDFTALLGRRFSVLLAQNPELSGSIASSFPRGAFPGDSVQGDISVANAGLDDATNVACEMYLSTDGTLDPSDVLVGTTTIANVPGTGNSSSPITLTIPTGTPVADYTLLLFIDANDQYSESIETDNLVTGQIGFATGYDLQPTAISSTNGANPGDTVEFTVSITNNGVPRVGSVDIEVYASTDQIYDASDISITAQTVTLSGNNVENFQVSGVLPQLAPGTYFPVIRVDPANSLVEMNELNNEFAASTPFPTGPDFGISGATGPTQIAPGSSGQFSVTVSSLAVPYTGDVGVKFYLSSDSTWDAGDFDLGTFQVTFAGDSSATAQANLVFPTSLAPATYYVIGQADPTNQIVEVDETNNFGTSANTVSNAYDFSVGTVTFSPNTTGAGGEISVVAQLRSTGVPFVGDLPYGVYLSSDDNFDPGDELVHTGNQFVAGLSTASLTTTFRLSNRVTIASWYVIVATDPSNTLPESNESNNASSSTGRLTINGADLYISEASGPSTGFIGRNYPISITIRNEGQADANDFRFAVYTSENEFITVTDPQIYVSQSATIAQGGQQTFQFDVTLPTYTSSQTVWLGVIADVFSNVSESRESNNVRRLPESVSVVFPIPDLEGTIIATATAAGAGEPLSVTRILRNGGVADATNVTYRYYLSNNPTIASDDVVLGEFQVSIPEGGDDYGIDELVVPSNMLGGTYYVGMVIDPDEATQEVDKENNTALGPQVRIYDAGIQFLTRSLPQATVGVTYQAGIYASGGALGRTWSVIDGTLPPGLTIDAMSGIIQGEPAAEGFYDFTVRASSTSGQADAAFSIRVLEPSIQLALASENLPAGIVGRSYRTQIIAIGGAPPYKFEQTNSNANLPGLQLTEQGVIFGTPTAPIAGTFGVRVIDSLENTASRSLAVNIITPDQRLKIRQIALRDALLDQAYCDESSGETVSFEATDGTEPYSWSQIGTGVPGMTLSESGQLCGTPTMAGEFPLTVRAQDVAGQFDTAVFVLRVSDGNQMAITTTSLPEGAVGSAYTATLDAFGGTAPLTWTVVNGSLPAGIALDSTTGALSGTPTAEGTEAFIIAVMDAQMRMDSYPLSIRVTSNSVGQDSSGDSDGCGCTTTTLANDRNSFISLLMLLSLGGLLMISRRRTGLFAMLIVSGFALLGTDKALAQSQPVAGTNYQLSRTNITYTNLSNPTVLFTARADENTQSVSLPFQFKFYDNYYGEVTVGLNGAIQMGAGTGWSRSNPTPGSASTPNGFIAPFQDDLFINTGQDGQVSYKVEGSAPTRTITFEWKNVDRYFSTSPNLNFQLKLFEGPSGRIQVRYGTSSGTRSLNGTMGMEDENGGRPIFFEPNGCTRSCNQNEFNSMTDTQVELVQDPGVELIGLGVEAPEFGYLGAQTNITVSLGNLHGNAVGPFNFEVRVARTRDMANAETIFTSSPLTFQAFQLLTTTVQGIAPSTLVEGEYFIALVVDSADSIMEVAEDNNQIIATNRIRLLDGKPDVIVKRVTANRTSYDVNASNPPPVTIDVEVENIGSETASNVSITGMLSTNQAISTRDVELGAVTVTLAPGESKTETITLTLPNSINSGTYWLGAYADPQNLVEELNESNNGRAALSDLSISGGQLSILTTQLPNGYVGVTYVALLSAVGGEGGYEWVVVNGQLPTGLGLVKSTGEIFGRPLRPESESITIEVTSGTEKRTQDITVTIADPSAPLTIVTRAVPAAIIGQEYSYALQTTGGADTSTLTWTTNITPNGIMLLPNGVLAGTPDTAGTSTLTVSVSDGTDTAERSLIFEVRENANLLIDTVVPPTAQYNADYSFQLTAKGGVPPLTWVLEQGSLPEGLELAPSGSITGKPLRVGSSRVVVEVRDSASGSSSSRDSNTFEFKVADVDGFEIVTKDLPTAIVGQAYVKSAASDGNATEVELVTEGGTAPISWRIVQGRLPERLFGEEIPQTGAFRISGSALEADEINLLVEATDAHGRVAQKAFLLRIVTQQTTTAPTETSDEGCSCAVASQPEAASNTLTSLVLLGLLGVILFRRRK